jgi:energy-coupling factor transport system ATP-binding protein
MIEFERVTYSYPGADGADDVSPVLDDVSLRIEEGEFVLVIGPSGSGKSTLLRCLNGLVPHFYGGAIRGRIRVAGRDPVAQEPRRMSDVVGFVFQNPETQAVVDVVEDELAFAMENCGIPLTTMRVRVEEVLDQLNIAHLRRRKLSTLSGGERQRVAIAAVLTLQPQVLVLDEPTSQLDPQAAEEVLDTLVKLNHDLGLTIVLSEHRLERVAQYADQILYMPGSGEPLLVGDPREVLAEAPLVPPIVELAKRLDWSPLPLTIKEARKFARKLTAVGLSVGGVGGATNLLHEEPLLEVNKLCFSYNGTQTLRGVDLSVRRGELVALMGRNGAGKSTLLKQCIGLLQPDEGQVCVLGQDTRYTPVEELARHVGYVPQNPDALLFADTIADELAFTRRALGLPPSDDASLLETLGLTATNGGEDGAQRYPRDLSTGERQRVALAAVLVGGPEIVLLDEPTRGLDYAQKFALVSFLHAQRERGAAILVVTHDVELVAQCAERVLLMGDGEIVVDGPVREVMSDSQIFGSQIVKLFRDPRYLTVDDVLAALR